MSGVQVGRPRGKRLWRAAILADTGASPYCVAWLNFWAAPGDELAEADAYARAHGMGAVVMVRSLRREDVREGPCQEPAEYGGEGRLRKRP